ncbi:hypothetical protein SUGI_1089220 [Cryptomeria japonica]|nr:hypothetical protein SUGI_1089220 [Cryptomeria japonica]
MVIEMAMKYLFLAITVIIAADYCSSLAVDGGDTLLLRDSLTGNQTIMSKNGMFALGFFSPRGTNNRYIGIWYAQIPEKTVVWVANRDNPVRSMPGVLQFSSDGHLRLFDGKGLSVWSTDIGQKGSRAVITDTGNFIMLGDGHNKSEIVWESFAHPGDTWLPGMIFWNGMTLTSWKSSSDPAIGFLSFGIVMSPEKTEMVTVYNKTVPFWSTGEWTATYFTNIHELRDEKTIKISPSNIYPSSIYFSFWIEKNLVGRIVLQDNGIIGLYYLMEDKTWNLMWSTRGGQCSAYDICGAYGMCYPNEVCGCVDGFTKSKNESHVWQSSGCERRTPLHCSATEGTTDGFFEEKKKYLPHKEAVLINNETTQQGCRTACLNNCSCTAFSFAISDPPICRLWFGELFGMRDDSSAGQSVFIRLAASELRRSTSKGSRKAHAHSILLPATGAAAAVVLAFLLVGFLLWRCRRQPKKSVEEDVPTSLKSFTYKENLEPNVEESRFYFPTWASSQIQRGNIIGVVDAKIANEVDTEEVGRAAMVGMLCIQDDENRRPSMREVVKILEGTMEAPALQIPRSVVVQVGQVDDEEDSDSFQFTSASKTTGSRAGLNWCCYYSNKD